MRNSDQVASQCGFLLYPKVQVLTAVTILSGVTVINSDAKPMVPSRNHYQ
jgi:hypothetical protein